MISCIRPNFSGHFTFFPSASLLAAAVLLFPAFLPLAGAQSTWTGATSDAWATGTNWDPSGVPSDVALTFGAVASGNYTIDLGATNRTAAGASALTFTSSNDYTFTNGTLGLANGAGMAVDGSGDAIFNIPVNFGSSAKFFNSTGSGALIFNGAVSRSAAAFYFNTHVVFAGSDNNSIGSGAITLSTNGVLELAKSTQAAQETTLGTNAAVSLGNAAILRVSNSSAVFTNNLTIGSGGGIIDANQSVSFGGLAMNGPRTITFTGPATVTFTGNLTQTDTGGGTRITTIDGAGNSIFNGAVNNNSGTSLTAITKSGAGTARFNSTTSNYTGPTTLTGGVLEVVSLANGGVASSLGQATNAAANLVFNGGTLRYVGAGNSTDRAFTLGANGGTIDSSGSGALTMTAAAMAHSNSGTRILTLTGTNTGNNSLATVINDGAGATSLAKTGSGLWSLSGANTYTGSTTVNAGTLLISGTGEINGSSGVTINSGGTFRYTSSTGLSRDVTLNTGGTFSHSGSDNYTGNLTWNGGTISGTNFAGVSLTVGANKTIAPGNSPGIMATGNQTWTNGGNYNLEIYDFDSAAGTGFDTIAITGTLDLSGLTTGGFNINLWSLSSVGPDVNGDALNFNSLVGGSWVIVSTTGGITGFNADNFQVNVDAVNGTAGFSNSLGGGSFSIAQSGNNLLLEFTPVPEPSTWVLITIGLGAVTLLRRRRNVSGGRFE